MLGCALGGGCWWGAVSCPVSGLPDAGTPSLASAGRTGLACRTWPAAPSCRRPHGAGGRLEPVVVRPVWEESGPVARLPLTPVLELRSRRCHLRPTRRKVGKTDRQAPQRPQVQSGPHVPTRGQGSTGHHVTAAGGREGKTERMSPPNSAELGAAARTRPRPRLPQQTVLSRVPGGGQGWEETATGPVCTFVDFEPYECIT